MNPQDIADKIEGELNTILDRINNIREMVRQLRGGEPKTQPLVPPTLRLTHWPTDYRVITQAWLARPEYYSQFNLRGHEGLDIRAQTGTPIYACADGVVALVAESWRAGEQGRKTDLAYGYHVRVNHECSDGVWQTVYAHCRDGSAKVKEGDRVRAGDVLALADATGNVQPRGERGSHLHLMVKKLRVQTCNLPDGDWFAFGKDVIVNPLAVGLRKPA
jgi:murein DD-endopeptidase MepM/ murein hydrolase activator NlpD